MLDMPNTYEEPFTMNVCKQCKSSFEITDEDRLFYQKLGPAFNQSPDFIPEPDLCHDCRLQAQLVFRNERYYYQRTCDLCKKSIIFCLTLCNNFVVALLSKYIIITNE